MFRLRINSLLLVLACVLLAPLAVAQTASIFTISLQQGQTVLTIADGATITMAADAIGVPTTANVTVTYRGTSTVTINTTDLTGSLDFSVGGVPETPFVLDRNQSFTAVVRFQPTGSTRVTGRMAFGYTEGRTSGTVGVNLTGIAPEFAFSYTPQGGNTTLLSAGGTIALPQTAIDATSTATVIVTNRGSGAGNVNAISLTGEAFQLVGVPLLPAAVEAGRDLRFTVSFTPRRLDATSGTLAVETLERRATFALQGTGSGARWAYDSVPATGPVALQPNQSLALPDAPVGERSTMMVRVRNTGNADGRITAISVSGTGFSLSDAPFLPLVVPAGGTATFTVAFAPTQAGRSTGRLRVGDDAFELAATGLGAIVNFAYIAGGASTSVLNNGTVVLVPVAVGGVARAQFQISNTGTTAATINSIGLTAASTVFALTGLPRLPLTLAPGASTTIGVEFAPAVVGAATATLRVDTNNFTLSGTGNAPPALPAYRFEGATGVQAARQQPAIGITLTSAYSLPLTGTLTLAFNSEVFSNDPAVQFETGGRTVSFTIPANATRAVFAGIPDKTQIRLQTGTVAGSIILTPSFLTEGGVNLTPAAPLSHALRVAQTAPVILSVAVSTKSASAMTLLVTGYSTSRALNQMEFTFTPVSGENVSTTRLTLSVEPTFNAWYQGSTSQPFGSLFTATVPFTFAGDVKNVTTLADTVQSVSVTASNAQGASAAQSVNLR